MYAIVAVDENWGIGRDGDQLVYLSEDLKRFKALTMGDLCAAAPEDAFVIGGGSVYQALLEKCDTVYVTKIQAAFPADTFFPNLDRLPEWHVSEEGEMLEQDGIRYHYVTYRRR